MEDSWEYIEINGREEPTRGAPPPWGMG